MNAPIALFVYARPDHTRRTIESLLKNPESASSDLIIFSDAARSSDKDEAVRQVRKLVSNIKGFRSLTIHHRLQNFGLAKSIIDGVSQVLAENERVIVLEDDIETSSYFLRYMNEALERYAEDERVISIHGYVWPVKKSLPEAFFLRGADCWGWSTWRRGWALFNPDGQFLLEELKRHKLIKEFNFNGSYSYSAMLQAQINGTNDSWAVRWYASAFLANKLTLYPGRSLVCNIGNDGSGTHCGASDALDVLLSKTPILFDDVVIEESLEAKKMIESFFRKKESSLKYLLAGQFTASLRRRIISFAKDWLPPFITRKLRRHSKIAGEITCEGPFSSWDKAVERSGGYDDKQILEKVLAATLKVKSGEAVFERDSVLFDQIQYSWPVVAGLMWAAALDGGRLSVLDFGGSLGSSYFQNRRFINGLKNFRWSVIEQSHFVEAGRKNIQDNRLVFYPTISECVAAEKPNVVLLSGVLQYLENPYDILDELLLISAKIILVDRTCFSVFFGTDVYKVQITPASIYSSRYPIRYFERIRFLNWFTKNGFRIVEEFSSLDRLDPEAVWEGFIFQKISPK